MNDKTSLKGMLTAALVLSGLVSFRIAARSYYLNNKVDTFCVVIGIVCLVMAPFAPYFVKEPEESTKQDNSLIRFYVKNALKRHDKDLAKPKKSLDDELRSIGKGYCEKFSEILRSCRLTYNELSGDYTAGEIFREKHTVKQSLINIGDRYTIYCDKNGGFILNNSDIVKIYPHADITQNFSGSTDLDFYVTLHTISGREYELHCGYYMDRGILAAYEKRREFLCPGCDIFKY